MHCTNCGSPVEAGAKFCGKCGAAVAPVAQYGSGTAATPAPAGPAVAVAGQPETKGRRVLAFLIDIVPALLIAMVRILPLIGQLSVSLLGTAYWLLRDVNGASPGKLVLGSEVVNIDGRPSTVGQRIGRNLTLAIPGLFATIPFIGIFIAAPVSFLLLIAEVGMLLATGRRIGDMLAGTTVVRK